MRALLFSKGDQQVGGRLVHFGLCTHIPDLGASIFLSAQRH